jgi:anti-anti-sigma regulatory factor
MMRITQRQAVLGLQTLLLIGTLLILLAQIAAGAPLRETIPTAVGFLSGSGVLYLYWRGWRYASHTIVLVGILISGLIPPDARITRETVLSLLIPPVIAMILGRPSWVVVSALATPIVLLIRTGGEGLDAGPPVVILYGMVVGGMALARLVTDTAQRDAQANARRADDEKLHAEQQAQELAAANEQMAAQIEQQRRLIDLVAALEIPLVALAEGVLLAPIVGHLDARRAQAFMTRLLQEAQSLRARMIVLDIAGVAAVDTSVAHALLDTSRALRLLGCEVALSGISATVAATMTSLGVDLADVAIVRGPQEALARLLRERTSDKG